MLTLVELNGAFSAPGSHDVAYWQSRAMVAWLEYHYPGSLRRLIDNLANGESFAGALYHATKLTPDDWWNGWEGGIPAYIYLASLFLPRAIFTLMALLVIVVVVIRILRKRRSLTEDEEEAQAVATQTAAGRVIAEETAKNTPRANEDGQYSADLLEDQ